MYTDAGIMPRYVVLDSFSSDLWMSLHMGVGKETLSLLVWLAHIIVIISFGIGYRTRTSNLLLWVFTWSLQVRNELCLHSGDVLMRVVLFFSMLLPLGTVCSVDAVTRVYNAGRPGVEARLLRRVVRGGDREQEGSPSGAEEILAEAVSPFEDDVIDVVPPDRLVADFTTVAYMAQIWIMYVFSVYHKKGRTWTVEYTATFYALQLDFFRKPLGDLLLMLPSGVLKFLTWKVWMWEKYGPMLYFSPFWTGQLRMLALFGFTVMHLSFGLSFRLAMFTFITSAAQMAFIPGLFWDTFFQYARYVPAFNRPRRILYSPAKPGYRWLATAATQIALLPGARTVCGPDGCPPLGVLCEDGSVLTGVDALVDICTASPLFCVLGFLLSFRVFAAPARWALSAARVVDRVFFYERTSVTLETGGSNDLVSEGREFVSLTCWAWRNVVAGVFITIIFCWCMTNVGQFRSVPDTPRWVVHMLHLSQSWSMFSENPPTTQWFYVIKANLTDGTQGDLFGPEMLSFTKLEPLSKDPPSAAVVAGALKNHRWFKIWESFNWGQGYSDLTAIRLNVGRYFCREWNAVHEQRGQKLMTFQWWIHHMFVHENGERSFAGKEMLWEHFC